MAEPRSRVPLTVAGAMLLTAALALSIAWGAGSWNAVSSPRRTHLLVHSAFAALCHTNATSSLQERASHSHPADRIRMGSVVVRMALCQTTVVAGEPLKAVLALENHTTRTLAMHECPGDWIYGGVVRGALSSVAAAAAVLCGTDGPPYLPPGTSYLTIRLPTVSSSCDRGTTQWSHGTPPCTREGGWPPSLPTGRYRTSVQVLGLPLRSSSLPPVAVTLIGCARATHCACSPVGVRPAAHGRWVPFC